MTKMLLITLIFNLILKFSIAQNLMNVNEVFDFNIGDKFQYEVYIDEYTTPNADRYTILDKYFSENSDTVFYIRMNDSYSTTFINGNPPYLEYHFQTIIDTVYYTNLDSLISESIYWTLYNPEMYTYDTLIYSSDYFCDSLINGYYYTTQDFEPEHFSKEYGKGIGLIRNYYSYPSEFYGWEYSQFYYEKDGIGCGIPDNTTSIDDLNLSDKIDIFPNPTSDHFQIGLPSYENFEFIIITSNGRLIDRKITYGNKLNYSCEFLKSGMYFVIIKSSSYQSQKKLIIR